MAEPRRDVDPKVVARLVAVGVFVVLFVAFILGNSQTVRVSFVFFDADIPLIWVLVGTAILGAVLDRLVSWLWRRKRDQA